MLLAVNAGSNTVSLFRVARGDKLKLKQVVASGGQFPVSIAVRGHLVYVLNAGPRRLRAGLLARRQPPLADPRLEPLAGPRQHQPTELPRPRRGWSASPPTACRLIVTTKASGSIIDVFDVGPSGKLRAAPVANPSATPVPFAFSFDPFGRLVMVEAGGMLALAPTPSTPTTA